MALLYPLITRFCFIDLFSEIRQAEAADWRRAHRVYAMLEKWGA